jgi:hypothetical protein
MTRTGPSTATIVRWTRNRIQGFNENRPVLHNLSFLPILLILSIHVPLWALQLEADDQIAEDSGLRAEFFAAGGHLFAAGGLADPFLGLADVLHVVLVGLCLLLGRFGRERQFLGNQTRSPRFPPTPRFFA